MKRTPLKRKTRLHPVSAKRRETFAARKAAMRVVAARSRGYCEAAALVAQVDPVAASECGRWATEGHEPRTRARGGDPTDPAQIIHACASCHWWAHAHPALASQVGLLESQWKA